MILKPRRFAPFSTELKSEHLERLVAARIHMGMNGGVHPLNWLSKANKATFNAPVYAEPDACFAGGSFFSCGAHSYCKSNFPNGVVVGRYCSIAAKVIVMPAGHPTDRLSTCGFDYSESPFHPKGFTKKRATSTPMSLVIGNDVWIGHAAVLGRGIKIGDGAVIGYGAIVTKDVPPYAVVAGVPATIRRYRFDERTIERLLKSRWWDADPSCLYGLDTTNVESFLDGYERLSSEGRIIPYKIPRIAVHEIFYD